ncbi:hypothetical protein GCM10009647_023880 [Streptomyces sanglieri]|nr:hypothetical protein [Streptomyces sp. Wh19]MDV9201871.1 hypothetical protein [Streptomyces sp. Wh19]
MTDAVTDPVTDAVADPVTDAVADPERTVAVRTDRHSHGRRGTEGR